MLCVGLWLRKTCCRLTLCIDGRCPGVWPMWRLTPGSSRPVQLDPASSSPLQKAAKEQGKLGKVFNCLLTDVSTGHALR